MQCSRPTSIDVGIARGSRGQGGADAVTSSARFKSLRVIGQSKERALSNGSDRREWLVRDRTCSLPPVMGDERGGVLVFCAPHTQDQHCSGSLIVSIPCWPQRLV